MFARWSAFLVWALVAASAVGWGLKLFTRPLSAPPQTVVAAPAAAAGGDWTRLFGAAPAPVEVAQAAPPPDEERARFQLIGVVAPRPAAARSQGVALIAIDGKTPRAYRVGAVVDGDNVLQSVQPRGVSIGPRRGETKVVLELPPMPPPATGVPGAVPGVPGAVSGGPPPAIAAPPAVTPNLSLPPQQRLRALGNPMPGQTWPQPVPPPVAPQVEPVQTDSSVGGPASLQQR